MDQKGLVAASVVSWIALIIAILALIIAWTAFNRTGDTLEQRIQENVRQMIDGIQEAPDREELEQPDVNSNDTNNRDTEEQTQE